MLKLKIKNFIVLRNFHLGTEVDLCGEAHHEDVAHEESHARTLNDQVGPS